MSMGKSHQHGKIACAYEGVNGVNFGNRRSESFYIDKIYRLYILLETALKSTSCTTVIFSSSNIGELQQKVTQSHHIAVRREQL
jgi:hypothetical protein